MSGLAGSFELVKTCGVHALPVNSETVLAAFGAANMTEEELMHLRLNHFVDAGVEQIRSSGCQLTAQLHQATMQHFNGTHANITRNPAPPASTGQTGTIFDMSYDLLDMSKIKTIGGN